MAVWSYRKRYFENNIDIKNVYQFARKVLDYYSGEIALFFLKIPIIQLLPVKRFGKILFPEDVCRNFTSSGMADIDKP